MGRRWRPAVLVRLRWRRVVLPLAVAVLALVAGIVTGALATGRLSDLERAGLDAYLGSFFHGVAAGRIAASGGPVFRSSLLAEARVGALIWIGGLFAFGFPLAVAALFARGFALGFTVGFLVVQEGTGGLALAALTVLPGSLVAMPALVGLAGLAVGYSSRRLSVRLSRAPRLNGRDRAAYMLGGLVAALALACAASLDGYVVPVLLRLLGPRLGL